MTQFVFVPSPNYDYSPLTGSANITRFHEISRRHVAAGGSARFIMGRTARFDYPAGECVRVDFPPQLSDKQRKADVISGWLGLSRRFRAARYLPAAQAIERDFNGPVFIYNDAAALAPFRVHCPRALLCLYCGNLIWQTFSPVEIRRMLREADRVICISEFLADDLRKRVRASRTERNTLLAKIVVIHNGVDLEVFQPACEQNNNQTPTILFVGRIQPIKGAHLLLEAAREIQRSGHKFRVRIVGSQAFSAEAPLSPYEKELRDLAAPLGDVIEFQPFVDRHSIAQEYQNADIFCMPSVWHEPFGLTLLEGMAAGLPTVASQRGAIPEIGGDSLQYFQPPGVAELVQILTSLLDDEAARCEWGQRARRRAEEFSWDRHYHRLIETLAEIRPDSLD